MPPTGYGPPPGGVGNRPPGTNPAMHNGIAQPPHTGPQQNFGGPPKMGGMPPGPNQFAGPPRPQTGPTPGGFPMGSGPQGDNQYGGQRYATQNVMGTFTLNRKEC